MNSNQALYRSIKIALSLRGLTYNDLAEKIAYRRSTIARFMSALKAGKSGSRFVRKAIFEYLGGKIVEEV